MNDKDKYFWKHRNLNIESQEMERKWRVFEEEEKSTRYQVMPFGAGGIAENDYLDDDYLDPDYV